MTEYIVDMYSEAAGVKCEPIVRCRDCKHYQVVDEIFDGEDDIAVYGCGLLKWKRASFCYEEPADPDGFCWCGERRDA